MSVVRATRGRGVLAASLSLLLSLSAGLSAFAAKPAHYVSSLTSSGGQGIVLPVKGQTNLTFEAKLYWVSKANEDGPTALGCEDRTDSQNPVPYVPICLANTRRFAYMYGANTYVCCANGNAEPQLNTDCIVRAVMTNGCQRFIWDGTEHGTTGAVTGKSDIDVPYGLFARYVKYANGTYGFEQGVSICLYYLRIYDVNGSLVFNGKPCLDSDGVAALYDTVTDEIYHTSSGTLSPGVIIDQDVPVNAYVSPAGAGLKSGNGWANAAPLSRLKELLAACKEHPLGGTIRFKKGIYYPDNNTSYSIGANTKLIGGYAGESDDEKPDPDTNKTIFTGSAGTIQWTTSAKGTGIGTLVVDNTACAVNLPPAADYPPTTEWFPTTGARSYGFVGGAATNLLVANVTFACSAGCVLSLTSASADGTVVSNCSFVGCAPYSRISTFDLANSEALVTDCSFVGNGTSIRLLGTSRAPLIRIRRCTFAYNHSPWSQYDNRNSCAIAICESPEVRIENCLFNANVATFSQAAAALYLGTGTSNPILVKDCVFTNNYVSGNCFSVVALGSSARGTMTIDGCRFSGNFGRPCLYSSNSGGMKTIRNSLFEGNSNATGSALLGLDWVHRLSLEFYNCEFRKNYSKGKGSMSMDNTARPTNLSIIHCLFLDDDNFDSSGSRLPEINWKRTAYDANVAAAFVDTIFAHTTASDYVAVKPYADEIHANCYLQGTDISSLTAYRQGWHKDDLTDIEGAPGLSDRQALVLSNRLRFDRLANSSPLRKKGRKVYLGSDGYCYLYHESNEASKKWQSLHTDSNTPLKYLTLAEGTALGLDPANKPIPDARGFNRPSKVSPGAVDVNGYGFAIIVR